MKRVEIYIPSLVMAGAEKVITDLACNINKTDIELTVVILSDSKRTSFYEKLEKNNIEIIDLSDNNKINVVRNIIKHLRQRHPDVVHANVAALQYLILPAILVKIPKKIYTVHGDARLLATDFIRKSLYDFAFHKLKFIPVVISRFVRDTFVEAYKIQPQDILVINNGVDIDVFRPQKKENKSELFNIIAVGRIENIKNYGLMIEAFKMISEKCPVARLTILGSGSMKTEIVNQIEKLSLADKITLIENVSNPQDYVSKSDLFISTSKTEGFSLVTLEALACGIPAVVTNSGGVLDIVEEGLNGFVCPHNAETIADKAVFLINNRDILKKMSEYAVESAKRFDIKTFAEKYKEIYMG